MVRRNKRFYAVIRGHSSPAIFTSWYVIDFSGLIEYHEKNTHEVHRAVACAFTNGYKGNKYKGFQSLEDAKLYMEEHDIIDYCVISNLEELSSETMLGNRFYYAVANGQDKGIYECFQYVYYQ
jgi:viroplasmin and RNaseH domain-containing protein